MRMVILGAPGVGKGTQATILCEKFSIPHISTGDIFRENIKNQTELGIKVKAIIDRGDLVPDEITNEITINRLLKSDCANGFILDGFPRNVEQAEYLDKVMKQQGILLDEALYIFVPDEVIIKRISGRRICLNCGKIYHVESNPPLESGICSECHGKVVQRDDDKIEIVLNRLQTYKDQTLPVIEYYKKQDKLVIVQGRDTVKETQDDVFKVLGVSK